MSKKKFYCIEGSFNFRYGNQRMLIEDEFNESQRHTQAVSKRQALYQFARKFEDILGLDRGRLYLGDARVFEVEPPKKIRKKKSFKQLNLFNK